MSSVKNILIVGVGGQGTLLASKVLGRVAQLAGQDVKQSEVHGMAQRGGSVVTYVRFGDKVFSPLIEKGQADMILAFETLESLRWADYLKPDGTLIINDQKISPMPVIIGAAVYPDNVYDKLADAGISSVIVNAMELAKQIGEVRAVNIILLGVAARFMSFSREIWEQAIRESVPAKVLSINCQAFDIGWNFHISEKEA